MLKFRVSKEEKPFEVFSTMGCRTVNGADINFENSFRNNIHNLIEGKPLYDDMKSAAQKDGRGNICPVTIILPTLAMECKKKWEKKNAKGEEYDLIEEFMKYLESKICEAKDMLIERFDWICKQPAESAPFMYGNHSMCGFVEEEGIKSALRHGTLVIGQLGLAECLQILVGCDQCEEKGMELGKRIEKLYMDKCNEFKKTYNYLSFSADEVYKEMIKDKKLSEEDKKELKQYCFKNFK